MSKDQEEINELLSIRAMAQMVVEKADRLIEKKTAGVSTPASSKNKKKMDKEIENFLIKRKKTMLKRSIRSNAEK